MGPACGMLMLRGAYANQLHIYSITYMLIELWYQVGDGEAF